MITSRKLLWFSVLIFGACSSGQDRKPIIEMPRQKIVIDTLPHRIARDIGIESISEDSFHNAFFNQSLNKKHLTQNGNYYIFLRCSDTTFKITWGNDTIRRTYDRPLTFVVVDRLWVKWENQDYIILDYGIGSGVWENIILPLNNKEQAQAFYNGLCFDKDNNLFTIAGRPWSEIGPVYYNDTVLTLKNLKSQQLQFAVEKEKHNTDILLSIDSVRIKDKLLYYEWATPSRYDDNKRVVARRIQVTI